jgi:hypothetical protein
LDTLQLAFPSSFVHDNASNIAESVLAEADWGDSIRFEGSLITGQEKKFAHNAVN